MTDDRPRARVIGRIGPAEASHLRVTRRPSAIDVTFTGRDLDAEGGPTWQALLKQLAVQATVDAAAAGAPVRLWALEKAGRCVEAVLYPHPEGDLELRIDVGTDSDWFWHQRYPRAALARLVADAEAKALQFQALGWAPA